LRYEVSIPLPKEDRLAINLLGLSLSLVVAVSLIVAAVAILLGRWILSETHFGILLPYIWLVPIGLLAAGSYQALANWAVRTENFPHIAQSKVIQGISQASSQLLFGLLRIGPLGLLVGDFIGQSLGNIALGLRSLRADRTIVAEVTI